MSNRLLSWGFSSTSQLSSLSGGHSETLSTAHKERGKVKEDYKKEGMFKEKKRLAGLSVFGIQVKDRQNSANGRTLPPPPSSPALFAVVVSHRKEGCFTPYWQSVSKLNRLKPEEARLTVIAALEWSSSQNDLSLTAKPGQSRIIYL